MTSELSQEVVNAAPLWIRGVTELDVYGVQWLLAGLRATMPDQPAGISGRVDPADVAGRLQEHVSARSVASWGRLIQELAAAQGVDRDAWGKRFESALDAVRMAEWVRSCPSSEGLRDIVELIDDLVFVAPAVGRYVRGLDTSASGEAGVRSCHGCT